MFAAKTALRFITFNKLQSFFIIIGIAVGIGVQIFVGILIDSLQKDLVNQTVGTSPHIQIAKEKEDIADPDKIINELKNVAEIKTVQKVVENNAFLVVEKENYPVLIKGFDLKAANFYQIEDKLIDGKMPAATNEVLIGKELKESAKVNLGNDVNLLKPDGKTVKMKIVGFYDLKVASLNNVWMITDIKSAQSIFELDTKISAIEMQVNDVFLADQTADKVKSKLADETLVVKNWKEQNAQLLSALQGQSTSSYMIQVFVLMSVIIAIASILAITVTQKSRQIGILKAMGITDGSSFKIFIYQGAVLGFFGVLLGLALGIGLFFSFVTFAKNADGTSIVNPYYRWDYITATALIAFAAAVLSGLMPALKSKRLNPIDIIRNG